MDWLEFFGRYGLPTIILAAISVFFAKQIWPFIVRSWENQQAERREERNLFLAALEKQEESTERIVKEERATRLAERDRFLAALEGHRKQLETIANTLEESGKK